MKYFPLLITILCSFAKCALNATENKEIDFIQIEPNSKVYVNPSYIHKNYDALYVTLENIILSVSSVGIDENGFYIVVDSCEMNTAKCLKCFKVFNDKTHNPWCPHDKRR